MQSTLACDASKVQTCTALLVPHLASDCSAALDPRGGLAGCAPAAEGPDGAACDSTALKCPDAPCTQVTEATTRQQGMLHFQEMSSSACWL